MSYAIYAFVDACHETMHCFQSFTGQKDSTPGSWSAEHDASVVALNLLHSIVGESRNDANTTFPLGIVELVGIWVEMDVNYISSLLDPDCEEKYVAWRDSFGSIPPIYASLEGDDPFVNFCKERLALDAYTGSKNLGQQLTSIFGRSRMNCDISQSLVSMNEENTPPPYPPTNYCTIYKKHPF